MDEILPEELIKEAYERMIGLIVRDSHLLKRDIIEIHIFTNNFHLLEKKPNESFCVLFRKTVNSHDMVGVSKSF